MTGRFKHPLFLNVFFLALLVSSCCVTNKYAQEAKKWEKDILKFEELDKINEDPAEAVLFVGSSSVRLWTTIGEDMAPYAVVQRGFGGSKYSDLACYADRIIYPHQFRALVIYEGNDIIGSAADKTPEELAGLLRYIVKVVRKKFPDKPIFVIEITPNKKLWTAWPKIKEANTQLARTCEKLRKVYFVPTSSYYLNEKSEPKTELFRTDMLHQNHEGYLVWSKLIKEKLDEVLKKNQH